MELLLWMWFYDSRWFFNFKISIKCYKYAWVIPFLIHLILCCLCFYYQYNSYTPKCETSLKLWLFCRAFFSLLVALNILIFIFKIGSETEKEKSFFENAKKIYPLMQDSMDKFDYWIRRKSLISTSGILLLISGSVSLFWSYVMIDLYLYQNRFEACDQNVISLLNLNSILIFIGNVPILIAIFFLLTIKIFSFISAFMCPRVHIYIAKSGKKCK